MVQTIISLTNEEVFTFLEGLGFNVVLQLHTDVVITQSAKDFVNLSDLLLVLQINWSIEIRYVSLCHF